MNIKTIFQVLLGILTIGLFVAAIQRESAVNQPHEQSRFALSDSIDLATGLAQDPNLSLVKAHCTGCHSPRLITQHRFTREEWLSKVRWMQRNHKLWDLGESEKIVLDYLAKYYAPNPTAYSRREALRNVKWYQLKL